ncbi:MAG: hypothetical protein CMJ78_02955 [Planctomycetaceae bacterium]|nr:hypothetical protein [Planctomycetaceae bacterium]
MVDPNKLKEIRTHKQSSIFFGVDRMPETSRLFCGSSDFKVYELDAKVEKAESQAFTGEGHTSYVTTVSLTGSTLVSGSYDGHLAWWNTEKREFIRKVKAHDKWIRMIQITPDGKTIVSVADDMLIKLWNAESGEKLNELVEHKPLTPNEYPSMLYAVTISSDGKLMATADKVGHIAVWDLAEAKKISELEAPVMYTWDPRQRRHSIGGIRSLAFSKDSKLLAAGGIGKIGNIDHLGGPSRIEVFDWQAKKRVHEISDDKFKGLVEQIEFHPSGDWFVAAGGDHSGFISIYDAKTGKVIKQAKAPMHVHGFSIIENWERIYGVGHNNVAVWTLADA